MKSIKFLTVALCTLLAGVAFAQDTTSPDMGSSSSSMGNSVKGNLEVALRVTYGLALGNVNGDTDVPGVGTIPGTKLSDLYSGSLPAQLDVGYRIDQNWFAGAYFSFAPVFVKGDVCPGGGCSANDMRFGIQGQYHVMPSMSLDPWVGLGVGYEIGHFSSGDTSSNTSGFEFANLSLGANYKVAQNFAVGPVLSFSLGQYSSAGGNDIPSKSMHELFDFGIRGVFDLQM